MALLVVYYPGQDSIVSAIGKALAQRFMIISDQRQSQSLASEVVAAIEIEQFVRSWTAIDEGRVTIAAHELGRHEEAWNDAVMRYCHFEYLYDSTRLDRSGLVRFLTFVLGQSQLPDELSWKERITVLSLPLAEVSVALPDIDILTIGMDAIELRIDALNDSRSVQVASDFCSPSLLRRQFALLRAITELPIIFTIRSRSKKSPPTPDYASMVHQYLKKAQQWGCDYVDIESWLFEDSRQALYSSKGSSRMIASWSDNSSLLNWTLGHSQMAYKQVSATRDVVRVGVVSAPLETARTFEAFNASVAHEIGPCLLVGSNLNSMGRTQTLNVVGHLALKSSADSGQMSAADINSALSSTAALSRREFYAVESNTAYSNAAFFRKCFNELGLPHQLIALERIPDLGSLLKSTRFGGLHFDKPLPASQIPSIELSRAAKQIGQVDIIVAERTGLNKKIKGDIVAWRSIRALLVRNHVPSAYAGKPAVLIASSEADAKCALYALKTLQIGLIYTIGFQCTGEMQKDTMQLTDIGELTNSQQPYAFISALPGRKISLIHSLLLHYRQTPSPGESVVDKVFIDLVGESDDKKFVEMASSSGWLVHFADDVRAWTIMVMMRMLVQESIPFDFVRFACGAHAF